MSRIWIRAKIEDAYIEAYIEGWIESDDWVATCDECAIPVHVTRIFSVRVKAVGIGWFPQETRHLWDAGRLSRRDAEGMLRSKWLDDDPEWRPRALGREIKAVRAPGPPPGVVSLFKGAE